jgi:predicted Fe-S protein YdhL (DUF1289 family)
VTLVDASFAETLALMQPGDAGDVDLFDSLLQRPAWMAEGACRSGQQVSQNGTPAAERPAVNFFPGRGESAAPAKAVCRRCPVRSPCLEFALEHDVSGVWGGTSERQRRQLLAGAPWSELSDDQRQAIMARALAPTPARVRPRPARKKPTPTPAPKRTSDEALDEMLRQLRERAGLDAADRAVKSRFG